MPHRHRRRSGVEQHRTPGRVAASPEAIAKRLRQDPPVILTMPRQNGRTESDAWAEVALGSQALWEREQQRLAREALERRP